MAEVKIITDAGADVTLEQQKEFDIAVLPLRIYADGKEYLAGVDTFSDDFYALLETISDFPKTSQPTTGELYDLMKKYVDEGKEVLFITLSSKASGLNNNANLAKNMLLEENPDAVIEVYDSYKYSFAYGMAVIEAAKLAKDGKSMEEIKSAIAELMDSYTVYFTEKIKVGRIHEPHTFIYVSIGLNIIISSQVYIFGLGQYF